MRIVHVTNAGGFGRTQSGGAERAVAELASALADNYGWEEHIVAPPDFFAGREISESVTRHEVELDAFRTSQMFTRGGPLAATLSDLAPDVVVGHLLRGTLVGLPAASSGNAGRVSILHNSLSDYKSEPGYRPVKHALNRAAFRYVARRHVDLHIAISEANRRDLVEHEGVRDESVVTIHNWVSDEFNQSRADSRDEWRSRHEIGADELVILVAGRLERQKNQELIVRLLPDLPDHTLVLAGEGSLTGEYDALARELGVSDRVHQIGFEPDIAVAMAAADVVAVPSRFEGFGRSVIEALAVGTPVVATRLDAIAEVLDQVPAGSHALCELDDQDAWRSALSELSRTQMHGTVLGKEVAAAVEAKYSLESAANNYNAAFLHVAT